ncbi:MAG TPA: glycosyltransferase family 39 protein, partial [Anaerolineae bacterium]
MNQASKQNKRTYGPTVKQRRADLTLWTVTIIIVFAAFCLRLGNINGEGLWRDEVDTIRFAFAPITELVKNLTSTGFNGPLYLLIVRIWLSIVGTNDFTLRFLSVIFGMAELVLVYVLAARLFDRATALAALSFAALSPILIWYSGEGKMYTLQPMLLLLALYALRRALVGHQRGWWIVVSVAISLGYYVHVLSPLFLGVAVLACFLWFPAARLHWRGALISLAICVLPYVPLAIWQLPTLLSGNATG